MATIISIPRTLIVLKYIEFAAKTLQHKRSTTTKHLLPPKKIQAFAAIVYNDFVLRVALMNKEIFGQDFGSGTNCNIIHTNLIFRANRVIIFL